MMPSRLVVAFLVFMTSIIGFCVIGYMSILDLDYWLEDVSNCLPGTCRFQWNNKCVSCDYPTWTSVDHQPGDELLSRKARGAGGIYQTKNKCEIVNDCLQVCEGILVNVCEDADTNDDIDRNGVVNEELVLECENDDTITMGHAGGDPVNFCENTVEATVSGLLKGMEAVHIDISFSQDQVPFLWRDHNPRSLTARLRQIGVWGVSRCRPSLAPHTIVPAHLLNWDDIHSAWHYVDRQTGMYAQQTILTYQEWILELMKQVDVSKLKMIWIEFRVPRELLRKVIYQIWDITYDAGLEDKLWFEVMPDGRVIFKKHLAMAGSVTPGFTIPLKEATNTRDGKVISSSQWTSLIHLLDQVQTQERKDTVFIMSREDEVVYSVLAELVPKKNYEHLSEEIVSEYSSRGSSVKEVSVVITSTHHISDTVKNIVDLRNDVTRDSCNPNYTHVAVWTINNKDEIEAMLCQNVDILITDFPSRVPKQFQCQSNLQPEELARGSRLLAVDCPAFCPRMYDPVCGNDGNTYSNECMMRDASCQEGIIIKIHTQGKCSDVPRGNVQERGFFTSNSEVPHTSTADVSSTEAPVTEKESLGVKVEVSEQERDCDSFLCSSASSSIPVCGSDFLTYENECFLEQSKCWGAEVNMFKSGPCSLDPCFNNCTDMLSPMCGSDGETYLNRCNLEKTVCKKSKLNKTLSFLHRGSCSIDNSDVDDKEGVEVQECGIACTRQFDPVCASDGETYSNRCMMELEACTSKNHLTVTKNGECSDNH